MPVVGEPSLGDVSDDPTSVTRWSYTYHDVLPADDLNRGLCGRHVHTIGNLQRTSFHSYVNNWDQEKPLPDWYFGQLREILDRRGWCRACAIIANVIQPDGGRDIYEDQASVIACWVWDGVLSGHELQTHDVNVENEQKVKATLRLRIAPEMVGWENSFEPFDLVPLPSNGASDSENIFTGRLVDRGCFNVDLARSWIANCTEWHGTSCLDAKPWSTLDYDVPFIRLISLKENKLVEQSNPSPYAALSYVWGTVPVFKTTKDNIAALKQPDGLLSQTVPNSIRDALQLARRLGFEFIWVDSICIIQDSSDDKSKQLRIMDCIYDHASLTIVAAAGDNANAGIPGLDAGSRCLPQHLLPISAELTLLALRRDSHRWASATAWNTRGWTYQERLLSRRTLYSFPDGSISFQCSKAVWGEDYRAETPRLERCAPMMDIALNRSWMSPGSVQERGSPTIRTKRKPYLQEYSRIIEAYTARNMSFPGDRLPGVSGVLNVIAKEFELAFVQGIPETILHMGLLWQPRNKLKRVPNDEKTGLPLFPSWSWAGWIGPVGYENWNEFNEMPEVAERARRVIPFTKVDMMGSKSIKPARCFSAFDSVKTIEMPRGWSKTATEHDGCGYLHGQDVETIHTVPLKLPKCHDSATSEEQIRPLGLRLRTKLARFRLTNVIQGSDFGKEGHPVESRGRFGLTTADPAASDEPWIGTILLPVVYHSQANKAKSHELVVLSESYGFNRQELPPAKAKQMQPWEVVDVMMVRRVTGPDLKKYQNYFSSISVQGMQSKDPPSWGTHTMVERIGVGRMLKSAWEGCDDWRDFILV